MASAIEQHCDANGIVWPVSLAPYHVYLGIVSKTDDLRVIGKEIYDELWKQGIETDLDDRAVAPGFIETEMTRVLPQEVRDSYSARIPLPRMGQPGDVAAAVAFLLGDDSSYLTGIVLPVDGGMST